MENIFYVYIHTRLDNGKVFYVGKGSGYRAFDKSGRNIYWNRVANKAGWVTSIVQDNMKEEDSYLLEMWLIAKFRHNGVRLCNITDGGEGGQGIPSATRKTVYCSNGMMFDSGYAAAEWMSKNGYPKARQGHIASVCRGERPRAYGHTWSYIGTPDKCDLTWKELIGKSNSKVIHCSNGMSFDNCRLASEWCRSNGHKKATQGRVSSAASGSSRSAYGFAWWYDGDTPKKYIPTEVSFECIGHGVFTSLTEAAEWVTSTTKYKAQGSPIKMAANGIHKHAYGYKWRLAI